MTDRKPIPPIPPAPLGPQHGANSSQLAPPQPPDSPNTRPPLNLPNVIRQVNAIQQFLADERARKSTVKTSE